MTTAHRPLTEEQFLSQVLELARLLGWRRAHFRPARTAKGWRTPCQADAAGFPDLLLLRRGELLVAELKADNGTLTPDQQQWLDAFAAAGVRTFVWRPSDWKWVEEVLTGARDKPPGT